MLKNGMLQGILDFCAMACITLFRL